MTLDFRNTPVRGGRTAPTMPEGRGHQMRGEGSTVLNVPRRPLWRILSDPERLAAAIPGAETLRREDIDGRRVYVADVAIGVGFLKGTFVVSADFAEWDEPRVITLNGGAKGGLGNSTGEGWVDFEAGEDNQTVVKYAYAVLITGAVAAVGGKMLDKAGNALIDKFFRRIAGAVHADRKARRAAKGS